MYIYEPIESSVHGSYYTKWNTYYIHEMAYPFHSSAIEDAGFLTDIPMQSKYLATYEDRLRLEGEEKFFVRQRKGLCSYGSVTTKSYSFLSECKRVHRDRGVINSGMRVARGEGTGEPSIALGRDFYRQTDGNQVSDLGYDITGIALNGRVLADQTAALNTSTGRFEGPRMREWEDGYRYVSNPPIVWFNDESDYETIATLNIGTGNATIAPMIPQSSVIHMGIRLGNTIQPHTSKNFRKVLGEDFIYDMAGGTLYQVRDSVAYPFGIYYLGQLLQKVCLITHPFRLYEPTPLGSRFGRINRNIWDELDEQSDALAEKFTREEGLGDSGYAYVLDGGLSANQQRTLQTLCTDLDAEDNGSAGVNYVYFAFSNS
jgi:hypothetical protein